MEKFFIERKPRLLSESGRIHNTMKNYSFVTLKVLFPLLSDSLYHKCVLWEFKILPKILCIFEFLLEYKCEQWVCWHYRKKNNLSLVQSLSHLLSSSSSVRYNSDRPLIIGENENIFIPMNWCYFCLEVNVLRNVL